MLNSYFLWECYISEYTLDPANGSAFTHIFDAREASGSCPVIRLGDLLEVSGNGNTCWPAVTTLICGSLIRLRYVTGADTASTAAVPASAASARQPHHVSTAPELWCDRRSGRLHARGWSRRQRVPMVPPQGLVLKAGCTAEEVLMQLEQQYISFDGPVSSPDVDKIVEGMKLELADDQNPYHIWPATILQRIGTRLLVRRDTLTDGDDVWLSVSSPRVRHFGWAQQSGSPYQYLPPASAAGSRDGDEWAAILEMCRHEARSVDAAVHRTMLPAVRPPPPKHGLLVGCRLETVHPSRLVICSATVIDLINERYFRVKVDGTDCTWVSCLHDDTILPYGWSAEHLVECSSSDPVSTAESSTALGFTLATMRELVRDAEASAGGPDEFPHGHCDAKQREKCGTTSEGIKTGSTYATTVRETAKSDSADPLLHSMEAGHAPRVFSLPMSLHAKGQPFFSLHDAHAQSSGKETMLETELSPPGAEPRMVSIRPDQTTVKPFEHKESLSGVATREKNGNAHQKGETTSNKEHHLHLDQSENSHATVPLEGEMKAHLTVLAAAIGPICSKQREKYAVDSIRELSKKISSEHSQCSELVELRHPRNEAESLPAEGIEDRSRIATDADLNICVIEGGEHGTGSDDLRGGGNQNRLSSSLTSILEFDSMNRGKVGQLVSHVNEVTEGAEYVEQNIEGSQSSASGEQMRKLSIESNIGDGLTKSYAPKEYVSELKAPSPTDGSVAGAARMESPATYARDIAFTATGGGPASAVFPVAHSSGSEGRWDLESSSSMSLPNVQQLCRRHEPVQLNERPLEHQQAGKYFATVQSLGSAQSLSSLLEGELMADVNIQRLENESQQLVSENRGPLTDTGQFLTKDGQPLPGDCQSLTDGRQLPMANRRLLTEDTQTVAGSAQVLTEWQLPPRDVAEVVGLSVGSALEVVHPESALRDQLCAGVVKRTAGHLVWICLLPLTGAPELIYSVSSVDLYPVGWAQRHGATLLPPSGWTPKLGSPTDTRHLSAEERSTDVQAELAPLPAALEAEADAAAAMVRGRRRMLLFIYPSCRCGPLLSGHRLRNVATTVGPSPVRQLARTLLVRLTSAARRVNRVLQALAQACPNTGDTDILKFRVGGAVHVARVRLPTRRAQLAPFCAAVCERLQCCPALVSQQPRRAGSRCPRRCRPESGSPPDGHGHQQPQHHAQRERIRLYPAAKRRRTEPSNDSDTRRLPSEIRGGSRDARRQSAETHAAARQRISNSQEVLPSLRAQDQTVPEVEGDTFEEDVAAPTEDDRTLAEIRNALVERERASSEQQEDDHLSDDDGGPVRLRVISVLKNPRSWTPDELERYLKNTGCAHLAHTLRQQDMDGVSFMLLTVSALTEVLGMDARHARALCIHAARLKYTYFTKWYGAL